MSEARVVSHRHRAKYEPNRACCRARSGPSAPLNQKASACAEQVTNTCRLSLWCDRVCRHGQWRGTGRLFEPCACYANEDVQGQRKLHMFGRRSRGTAGIAVRLSLAGNGTMTIGSDINLRWSHGDRRRDLG